MTRIAMLTVINIAGNFPVFTVHSVPVVFMTGQAAEYSVITGADMAVTALIPNPGMTTSEYGKHRIMLRELGWFPSIETVAGFADFTESSLDMIGNLNAVVFPLMAGITIRLKGIIFALDLTVMATATVQSGVNTKQWEGRVGMRPCIVDHRPALRCMTSLAPWAQPTLVDIGMTIAATTAGILKVLNCMALNTRDIPVIAFQWKGCCTVVKPDHFPVVRIVTLLAIPFHNFVGIFLTV
jgi:hypothetical protein